MKLIIYHGEPTEVNIYSGTVECEANLTKGPISAFQKSKLQIEFWLQKPHLRFDHHL